MEKLLIDEQCVSFKQEYEGLRKQAAGEVHILLKQTRTKLSNSWQMTCWHIDRP